jgi:peptide/nickel transport system substrate-binding protein
LLADVYSRFPSQREGIMRRREFLKATMAAPAVLVGATAAARAQGRAETLVIVQEYGPNSLDMQGIGASQPVNGVAMNCYDRLLSFKRVALPDGSFHFDGNSLAPELAESWQEASDGMSCVFKLRADARFHDGAPVTARDVKWSLDRAVTIGGFATSQMRAGSLERPEQFVALDDLTFRLDYVRKDKMTLPDLVVTIPFVFNAALAQRNTPPNDPWAQDYLKNNVAGSGAFKVESWKPGTETVYVRNDAWVLGPRPALRRVIARDIASPANRRALLERGDADMSYGLPPKDFQELQAAGKLKVVGLPVPNAIWYVAMNTVNPPFDNATLRQAVAYALPYEQMMRNAFYGRAKPMFGATDAEPMTAEWPQPFPYRTDLARAKALMAEAGFGAGLSTTLSFDMGTGTIGEPMAVLIAESLGQIGIKVEIDKIPGANWRNQLNKKSLPMVINRFGGWLDYPDYFFFWNYHGQNSVFNVMSYQNPAMDRLIDGARAEPDKARYAELVRGFLKLGIADVPIVPICQPLHDVAMQSTIKGYQFWFHREPDFRFLAKA